MREQKSSFFRQLVCVHLFIVAILLIWAIATHQDVKAYRNEIANKYGITCAWYEKPVFYDKSKRMDSNDYTGNFIVKHNRFDCLSQWSGERKSINAEEMEHFEKLQDNYTTALGWLILVAIGPYALLLLLALLIRK